MKFVLAVLLLVCSVNGSKRNGQSCYANKDCKSGNCGYYSYDSKKQQPIFQCQAPFDPLNPVVYAASKAANDDSCSQDFDCETGYCAYTSYDSINSTPVFQCEPSDAVYNTQALENFQICIHDSDCQSDNCGFYGWDSDNLEIITKCVPPFDPENPIVYSSSILKRKNGARCLVNANCKSGNCGFYGWDNAKKIPILHCKAKNNHKKY